MLEDPLGIDRRLRETARALQSFRSELRHGRGEDHAFEFVGRKISRELIAELAEATHDPLAPALLRWALRVHEEHALVELDLAHAAALRVARHPVDAPERGEFTLEALLEHALANTKGERAAWLELLLERGERATDFAVRRAERRAEVRASLARFVPAVFGVGDKTVRDAAERWLSLTDEAFATLGVKTLAELVTAGLGRDSHATWPARVTPRSIAELFRETRWLTHAAPAPDLAVVALGASSFLRALLRFGANLRAALADERRPFTLAHDAFGLERATFGSLFAGLPYNAAFAKRALGVSAHGLSDHRRTLAQVLLVATREAALRALLFGAAFDGQKHLERAYAEWTFRALGVELGPRALGVLFTPRPTDAARFAGALLASDLDRMLTDTHDEDWYRNPRAVEELRENARLPPATEADGEALERGATRLAAALGAAL
jgi:hypothetical protein